MKTRGWDEIVFGTEEIDLACVSQIVSESQTRAIGAALLWAKERGIIDGEKTVRNVYNTSFLHADTILSDLRTVLQD